MAEIAVADVGGMSVHTAKPEGSGPSPAVIVIQEIFGVDPHIQDVAKRFADAGYFAAAPELFHRSGAGTVIPYASMQDGFAERQKLSNDDILADVNATVAYLQGNPDVDSDHIGIVGFCFGGMVSYLGAAQAPGITAGAIFYGGGMLPRPDAPPDAPRLLDQTVDSLNVPLIGFWGDADQGIPPAVVQQIEETLKAKGKELRVAHLRRGRPRLLLRGARRLQRGRRQGRMAEGARVLRNAPEVGVRPTPTREGPEQRSGPFSSFRSQARGRLSGDAAPRRRSQPDVDRMAKISDLTVTGMTSETPIGLPMSM